MLSQITSYFQTPTQKLSKPTEKSTEYYEWISNNNNNNASIRFRKRLGRPGNLRKSCWNEGIMIKLTRILRNVLKYWRDLSSLGL